MLGRVIFLTLLGMSVVLGAGAGKLAAVDLSETVLFVSLGSVCRPAACTRLCGVRTASFPFDWIVSMDGERFIELLDDDFSHFFDMDYLLCDADFLENVHNAPVTGNVLLNTYYHLEFLHEGGNWRTEFFSTLHTFRMRYERRIARFRGLKNFPGKVIFMRAAHPIDDPHRFFRFKENDGIADGYAFRLHEAIQRYFPGLDFTLVVMNLHGAEKKEAVQRGLADTLFVLSTPLGGDQDMVEVFKAYFHYLMGGKALLQHEELGGF